MRRFRRDEVVRLWQDGDLLLVSTIEISLVSHLRWLEDPI
jgi:hypothetical protein